MTKALLMTVSAAAVAVGAGDAHAAEIDFSPLVHLGIDYGVEALLLPAAGWLLWQAERWLGLKLSAEARATVLGGVERIVRRATAVHGRTRYTVETHVAVVADGTAYLLRQVPGALKQLGMGPEDVGRLIDAEIATRMTPAPDRTQTKEGVSWN